LSTHNFQYADISARIMASLIDLFIFLPLFWIGGYTGLNKDVMNWTLSIMFFFYKIFCWTSWEGQTIGAKMWGVKLIKKNGEEMTFKTSILRMLFSFVPFSNIWVFVDRKKQTLADHLANTYLIKV
jgi:uncharacterized RDD family membrane protein YckC